MPGDGAARYRFFSVLGVLVYIVDDDPGIGLALSSLVNSVGYLSSVYESAVELLSGDFPVTPSCLLLDVRLQGTNGLPRRI